MTVPARSASSTGITVRIERLATGGDGVGRMPDGRTVFVPRTAPGDLVELAQVAVHARFARGRVGMLQESGPSRVPPRCRHYVGHDCGGCQLQHLDPAVQRDAKRSMLADTLRRIGKLDVVVPELVAAPMMWDYRSRITLAPGPGMRFAGFHPVDQPMQSSRSNAVRSPIRRCATSGTRSAPTSPCCPPIRTQIILRVDRAGGEHLTVKAAGTAAWTEAKVLATRCDRPNLTIWWHPDDGVPRIMAGRRETTPATVFEQVFPAFGDQIREYAIGRLGPVAGIHGWDLYSGIGDTTRALLALGATVESVELDRRAVEWAAAAIGDAAASGDDLLRQPTRPARLHTGLVERVVGSLDPATFAITNPPRTGMAPAVVSGLLARPPRRLVYISCDPATLSRDLGRLCGGAGSSSGATYRLTEVQPFDLFPQTAHLETVAVLEAV